MVTLDQLQTQIRQQATAGQKRQGEKTYQVQSKQRQWPWLNDLASRVYNNLRWHLLKIKVCSFLWYAKSKCLKDQRNIKTNLFWNRRKLKFILLFISLEPIWFQHPRKASSHPVWSKITMELSYLVLFVFLALAWCGGLQVLIGGILQDEGCQLVTHVNIAGVTARNASLRDHLLLYGHNLHKNDWDITCFCVVMHCKYLQLHPLPPDGIQSYKIHLCSFF